MGIRREHTFGTYVRIGFRTYVLYVRTYVPVLAVRFPNKCSWLYRTFVRYRGEQTFFLCKNKRSSPARTNVLSFVRTYVRHLQEQTFVTRKNKRSFANICSYTKERLFAAGQTKSPSRRRGNFILSSSSTDYGFWGWLPPWLPADAPACARVGLALHCVETPP